MRRLENLKTQRDQLKENRKSILIFFKGIFLWKIGLALKKGVSLGIQTKRFGN